MVYVDVGNNKPVLVKFVVCVYEEEMITLVKFLLKAVKFPIEGKVELWVALVDAKIGVVETFNLVDDVKEAEMFVPSAADAKDVEMFPNWLNVWIEVDTSVALLKIAVDAFVLFIFLKSYVMMCDAYC